MKDYKVAERYAQALLDISGQNVDKTLTDLKAIQSTIVSNPSFKRYLWSPRVNPETKKALLIKLYKEKIATQLFNFLILLLRKNRINILLEIVELYEALYNELMHINKLTVVTAVALESSLEEKLIAKLEAVSGMKVNLVFEVDESIIGGMVLKTSSHLFDGSIRRQLSEMKSKLCNVTI